MYKVNQFIICLFLLVGLFLFNGAVLAQTLKTEPLPSPGLTPDSPFYFLDNLFEKIREVLTFAPEAKARLQAKFAAERAAEIKAMLKRTKGDISEDVLNTVQQKLKLHQEKAAQALEQAKSQGKEISQLASQIARDFQERRKEIMETFLKTKSELLNKQSTLLQQLEEAVKSNDTEKADAIKGELEANRKRIQLTNTKKNILLQSVKIGNKKLLREVKEEIRRRHEALEQQIDEEETALENALENQEKSLKTLERVLEEAPDQAKEFLQRAIEAKKEAVNRFKEKLGISDQESKEQEEEEEIESVKALKRARQSLKKSLQMRKNVLERIKEKDESKAEQETEKQLREEIQTPLKAFPQLLKNKEETSQRQPRENIRPQLINPRVFRNIRFRLRQNQEDLNNEDNNINQETNLERNFGNTLEEN